MEDILQFDNRDFIVMPRRIMYDEKISAPAKLTAVYLVDAAYRYLAVDLKSLARDRGLPENKIQEHIAELVANGYLKDKDKKIKISFKHFNTLAEDINQSQNIVEIKKPLTGDGPVSVATKYYDMNEIRRVTKTEFEETCKIAERLLVVITQAELLQAIKITRRKEPDIKHPLYFYSRKNVQRILNEAADDLFGEFKTRIKKPEDISLYHALKKKIGGDFSDAQKQKKMMDLFELYWEGKTREEVLALC